MYPLIENLSVIISLLHRCNLSKILIKLNNKSLFGGGAYLTLDVVHYTC